MHKPFYLLPIFLAFVTGLPSSRELWALDSIQANKDGKQVTFEGRIVSSAEDGGRLLQTSSGVLIEIKPEEVIQVHSDDLPFKPITPDDLGKEVLQSLPPGFQVHKTANYVICYNTSKSYAVWCGSLLERLNKAFVNYWSRRGVQMKEPEFPLPVVIFSSVADYQEYSKDLLGEAAGSIVAYYNLMNNRILMYDLTGAEALRAFRGGRDDLEITKLLALPGAEPLVATVVHEATHQIAFNVGVQTRLADNPLWFTEGLAIYFESPDLKSSRGWKGIGNVNRPRLAAFREGLKNREVGAFETLIANDDIFRSPQTGAAAYADAWALNYFLIRKHGKEYQKYLQTISEKPMAVMDTPKTRLDDFKSAFGDDLKALEGQFLRYMQTVR